jgi:hypothetical protein
LAVLPFSIEWRDVAIGVIVFVLVLLGFGVLSAVIHWPNEQNGYPLVVTLAAIVAFLPIIARTFTFLQQSRASVEGPFGIKINFSAAAAVATVGAAKLTENLVQPGVIINETSFEELNKAALRATEQSVVVVNLEDGRAWYKTRLFALAGTADLLHAPKSLVVVGQRGGQPMCVAGWIRPRDIVKALTRFYPGYDEVWQRGQRYLHLLQSQTTQQDPLFPKLVSYQTAYAQAGSAAIMFILVDQMRNPDQPAAAGGTPSIALESPNPVAPDWMTLTEAEWMFDPWLVRDGLDLGKPQSEQVNAIMTAKGDMMIATREGQYAGLIDVPRAERELLRQLLVRPASS